MSDDDAAASFVLDYELSTDDLREWIGAERSAGRRRKTIAVLMTLSLAGACAGTVAYLVIRHKLASCVTAEPTPRYAVPHVWLWWQCDPGSPSALLWNDAELVAAVVVLWSVGISYVVNFWRSSPRRQATRTIASPGAAGTYREEISAAGITSIGPSGVITYFPWSFVTSVRETDQRFFLLGTGAQARLMLPKRGLSEPASVPALSDFLHAAATGSNQRQ